MNSSTKPYTEIIPLHRQEFDLSQQKSMPVLLQEEVITKQQPTTTTAEAATTTTTTTIKPTVDRRPIEILTYQRQRHPHRLYQPRHLNQFQYPNSNQYQSFGNDIEIARFLLKNWKVTDTLYNERLGKYLTFQQFTSRVKKFNATSRKLRFYQIMMHLLLSVIVSIFLLLMIAKPDKKVFYGTASLLTVAIAFVNYWFFIRNGKLQTKYLNKLIRKFNKDDVPKNIYWKLIRIEHNETTRFYLVIELSGLRRSLVYERKTIPQISTIQNYDQKYLPTDIHRSNFVDNVNKVDNVVNVDNRVKVDSVVNVDRVVNMHSAKKVNNVDNMADNVVDNADNVNGVDNVTFDKDNIPNANNNAGDNDYDNNKLRVASIQSFSTRVSVESAQIHTAIRTRPYQLKLPTYYDITSINNRNYRNNKVTIL